MVINGLAKKYGIEIKGINQVRCNKCRKWFGYDSAKHPNGTPCSLCGDDDRIIKD